VRWTGWTLPLDVDLNDTECLKLAVSKGLGIGIVAASAIVKVPLPRLHNITALASPTLHAAVESYNAPE
jgi:hypothetical protein